LVEEFFAWVKQQQAECVVQPQSKTGKGLQYCVNQEKYSDEKGHIDPAKLDYLMPWSESLPEECREPTL